MRKFGKLLVLVFVIMLFGAACSDNSTKAPTVENDNEGGASFKKVDDKLPRVPVDTHIYVVGGQVISDPHSLTRQTDPGGGSVSGYGFGYGGGFVSGSVFGARYAGKGFVRVKITTLTAIGDGLRGFAANPGDVVLIKTSDTKAAALIPQDVVTFKCRIQYEAIAPIQQNERFNKDTYGTWEFDFCRLVSPDIGGS